MIYFPGKELHPAEHLADWVYYRREIQVADCDLMKHGREQEKIVTVNEPHFYRIAGEFLLQLHRDCQAHKAAAQNDYPLSRRIVHEAPRPVLSDQTTWLRKRYGKFVTLESTQVAPLEPKELHSRRPIQVGGMSFLSEVRLEESFGPFVAYQRDFGLIPNLLRAQSLLPRLIEAQAVLESAICLADGSLSRTQRERILLCAGAAKQDAYGVALGSRTLLSLGVSDRQIDELLNDFSRAGLRPPMSAFCTSV